MGIEFGQCIPGRTGYGARMSPSEPEAIHADTDSGYRVPMLHVAGVPSERSVRVLILPALGIEARLYRPLGAALARAGIDAAIVEHRGYGLSAIRPSRAVDFGWKEMLTEDIPAAWRRLSELSDAAHGLLLGHSLGGHLATIAAGNLSLDIDGLVLAATATPWVGAYRGRDAMRLRVLCRIVGPLSALAGFYPGAQVGFGGREARGVMADWLALARTNRYAVRGWSNDLEAGIARFDRPVLSLRMTDDPFGLEPAIESVLAKFRDAPMSRLTIDAAALGAPSEHYRWARQPQPAVDAITSWLAENSLAESSPM